MLLQEHKAIIGKFKLLVGGVKYHPLVFFDVQEEMAGRVHFTISCFTIDSRRPNTDIRLTAERYQHSLQPITLKLDLIPIIHSRMLDIEYVKYITRSNETFLYWLKSEFMKLSNHEIDEFFQFNGELVNDPHKHD